MHNSLPNLNWLRAFEAAARLGSFTAAARELNLTQAAISYQIRALEQRLGRQLFQRLPGGLVLTDLGTAYLPGVRGAFEGLSISTAGLFSTPARRVVTVRGPISTIILVIGPRLETFQRLNPGIEVHLLSARQEDREPDPAIDLEIRFGLGRWPGYRTIPIARDNLILIAPPVGVGEMPPVQGLKDLEGRPMIHVLGYQDEVNRILSAAGLEVRKIAQGPKVDTNIAAIGMVQAGLGYSAVLKRFARAAAAGGQVTIPLESEIATGQFHYYLERAEGNALRPEALLFRDWLLAEMAD